jgi:CrcB protein
MNQVIAVALGGSFGAVLRFFISTGVYQWLGRDFPYGTLAVNVLGSFLIGLMTEALILERVALSMEYRSAILIGLFGSLTTFSTFSLESLYLIEQGQFIKASLNIFISVLTCILAVWIGLLVGKVLFTHLTGSVRWMGWFIPYGLLIINAIGAFLIGFVCTVLLTKTSLLMEYGIAFSIILIGTFITLSSLYLVHYFFEQSYSFESHLRSISAAIASNIMICGAVLWLGLLLGRQV